MNEVAEQNNNELGFRSKYVPDEINLGPVGTNYYFVFDNGLGASLLVSPFAYGGAEIAILKEGEVYYDTDLNPSAIFPCVTPETVDSVLDQIAALPSDSSKIES